MFRPAASSCVSEAFSEWEDDNRTQRFIGSIIDNLPEMMRENLNVSLPSTGFAMLFFF